MDASLPLNWLTVIPLLIAVIAATTTLRRAFSAHVSRAALADARAHGYYADASAEVVVNHAIRREWIRMGKHAVIITAVVLSFTPWLSVGARNVAFAILSCAMMSNSLLDAAVERFVMERGAGRVFPHKE